MNKLAWSLIASGLVLVALFIAYAMGYFKDLRDGIEASATWILGGGLSLSVLGYGLWLAVPNFLKKSIAWLIRLAPSVPNYLKRRAIRSEIESAINSALKQFSREGAGFVEHEIKISWLKPGEDARDVFFSSGRAYLKLDYSASSETAIVEAALLFCRRGLLQEARQYIPRQLMRAIDLQFVDEVLRRRRSAESRAYFVQEVMPREVESNPETERLVERLQLISQHGLFTRVLLPELRDYPATAPIDWPYQRHASEIEEYLTFIEAAVRSRENGTKAVLLHVGQIIRIGIILVGIPDKLLFEGSRPYVRRAAINEDSGAHTIYLLGYNEGMHYVEAIAKETLARGLAESYNTELYDATIRDGVRRHKLARLTMKPGAGSRFLDEHSNTDDWPSIEEDIEWQEILARVKAGSATTGDNLEPSDQGAQQFTQTNL